MTMFHRVVYLLKGHRLSVLMSRSALLIAVGVLVVLGGIFAGMSPLLDVPGRAEAYFRLSQWNVALAKFLIGNPLPQGLGLSNKVVVVADDAHTEVVKPIFERLFLTPVLTPQPEQVFEVIYVSPNDFDAYKAYRNVIVVGDAGGSGQVSKALRSLLPENDPKHTFVVRQDVWARNQMAIGILGSSPEVVADHTAMQGDKIVSAIDESMANWLASILYHLGENEEATAQLTKQFGWQLRVPVGFDVMEEKAAQNFVAFVRQQDRRQLWAWVYWEDGIAPQQLTKDWCLEKRNEISKTFFDGDFAVPEDVTISQVAFAGKLAVRLEGLWENVQAWQGGPFKCYALVDASQKRFYLINIGVYAPNRDKALHLRQLDVLAHTFRIDPVYASEK